MSASLTFCGASSAASLEETFNQASQAYSGGDFTKAGQLFTEAGDMMYKSNQGQAIAIYGNASVAYIQGKNYAEAVELYQKILGSKAKIDNGQKLKYFQNLVFCLGQLEQYALQASEIDKVFSKGKDAIKIKLTNDEKSLLLATQGDAYRHHELYDLAVSSYSQSLKALPKDATPERRATLLTALGLCEGNLGLYDNALQHLQEANTVAQKGKLDQTIAESLSNLGIIHWEQGDYNNALKQLSAAIDAENKANLQRNIGVDKNNLGLVYKALGNYKNAMTLVQNSLDIAKEVKNEHDEGIATVNRALLYRIAGQYEDAVRDYNKALEIFTKIDFKEGIAGAKLGIGKMIALKDHNYTQTLQNYEEALKIYQDLKLIRGETETLIQLGVLYKDMLEGAVHSVPSAEQLQANANANAEPAKPATAEQQQKSSLFGKFAQKASNRDLVFEEAEPASTSPAGNNSAAGNNNATASSGNNKVTPPTLTPEQQDWLKNCHEYHEQALANAEKLQAKEFLWSSHQGLGYCAYLSGDYPQAYEHYKTAIDIVTNIYTSVSDVENFGEYMAGKEDLYTEAQAVCHAMYSTTQDQQYLSQMIKYADTLQNEVQKASASLVDLNFVDPEKQKLFDRLSQVGKQLKAAEKAVPLEMMFDKTPTADEKAQQEQSKEARKLALERVEKLNSDFNTLKAEWCEKYPQDRVLFESSSRVDTKMLQDYIKPDQIVLMYTQLQDMLLITAVNKDSVENYTVAIGRDQLDTLIRDKFIVSYLEGDGFGRNWGDYNDAQFIQSYDQVTDVLAQLYQYLVAPVESSLQGKKRIYVVASGLIAQTPFGALVKEKSGDLAQHGGNVDYLIKHYDIGYLRPAFIDSALQSKRESDPQKVKRLFAVANPFNANFQMPVLDGTISEIANANKNLGHNTQPNDIGLEVMLSEGTEQDAENRVEDLFKEYATRIQPPTEQWVRQRLQNNKYEIVYFSTHGMPYSNVVSTLAGFEKSLKKNKLDFDQYVIDYRAAKTDAEREAFKQKNSYFNKRYQWFRLKETRHANLMSNSPLNGLLYLSSNQGDDSMIKDVPPERDGLLTIKEVLELPNDNFSATKYVILSACNTGVTYVSSAMAQGLDKGDSLTAEEAKAEMEKLGLLPGVDQVSFVDTFMRKGVDNVYGTLWFVDDAMSSELLTRFMTNLKDTEHYPDAVAAFNQAQRSIVLESEAGKTVVADYYLIPAHPFFWAPGAMFGK